MNTRHPAVLAVTAGFTALAITILLAASAGAGPGDTLGAMWRGTFGNPFSVGSSLNTGAAILLIACGFIVAHRAGLINVGGEGQLCLGAIGATAVGVNLPAGTSPLIGVPLALAAAAVFGAAWAAIPAALVVLRGVNEVITTLLLNFVGLALVMLSVHSEALLRQPVTSIETLPQSEPLAEGARLPLLGITGSPATIAIGLALATAVGTAILLRCTTTGLRLRAVGQSLPASRRLGLNVGRLRFWSLTSAGALAGVAGGTLVASAPYVLADGLSSGYGFTGLVAGLLARGSLIAATLLTFVLALLVAGGINLQLEAGVPASLTQMTEAILVLLVAGSASAARIRPRGGGPRTPPPEEGPPEAPGPLPAQRSPVSQVSP